jgi:6-phosphogluconolactonase/glucosamine-6-phosphate isomerase/deaminase
MTKEDKAKYVSPEIRYFKTRTEFDIAVGEDFIQIANKFGKSGGRFLVGLSHGQSPAGAYQYILTHYKQIKRPELIRYTFVNTPLKRQRDLKENVLDAKAFLRALLSQQLLEKKEIIGSALIVSDKEAYAAEYNRKLAVYLKEHKKEGLDYVFLATNPAGHVAGISRKSEIFDSVNIVEVVNDRLEKEITFTPHFLMQSKRIAFLATKSDKRRALAWLLHKNGKPDESPSFLRFIDQVEKRLIVFIDDAALTWPQIAIERKTRLGTSTIKVDLAKPYNANAKKKLPVLVLIHGFLGLNSFDGILTHLPLQKYIPAAMHYGSVPDRLEVERYSKHIVNNIDAVVSFFGEKGHPVYILDHSMGNIYFMMINKDYNRLKGIQQYLCGRIGANPFFGKEAKQAVIGFLDSVILPSLSIAKNPIEKSLFMGFRGVVPLDTKKGVRKRGINMTDMLIRRDSGMRDRIWKAMKGRIIYLMTNMDSLPQLNKIPIERALHRLPAKLFVIQIYSALLESKEFDKQEGYSKMQANNIPILILKSENDCIAKFDPKFHTGSNVEVRDVTNHKEKDLFKEHLYHMVFLDETIEIIDKFISKVEKKKLIAETA